MSLSILASIVTIFIAGWALFFGSKTIAEVINGLRGRRPIRSMGAFLRALRSIRIHPSTITNLLLAIMTLILVWILVVPALRPLLDKQVKRTPVKAIRVSPAPSPTRDNPRMDVNALYAAWRGIEGDSRIYWGSFDGTKWSDQQYVPSIRTSNAPALSVFQGKLYIVWRGAGGDEGIYFASFDGSKWSTQQLIPSIGTYTVPALVVFQGKLYMAWRGTEGNPGIYFASFDGSKWSIQQHIPSVGTNNTPSLAAS